MTGEPSERRTTRWWRVTAAAAALVGLLFALIVGRSLGRWLVVEDPLQKADAILVLSGGMPGRVLEASRIYNQGYAPQVWLSYSLEPRATLEKYGVAYTDEAAYDKRILVHEGVPESAIRLLEPPIVNTADEIRAAGQALRREKEHRIIIVTSKVHTRRAKMLWNRLARQEGAAIVRSVSDDAFDAAHWWSNTTDALDVVREVLGLLNAWAGLPLQPAA